MNAKQDAQRKVRKLRQQGLSYREIMQRVPVSKSSVSLWCRDVVLTEAQAEHLRQRKAEAGMRGRQLIAQLQASGSLHRRHRPHASNGLDGEVSRAQEAAQIRALYEVEQLGVREVAARLGFSFWRVYRVMQEHGIPRRRGSEQNYATSNRWKPQFTVRKSLAPEDEELRAVGTVLYRAEGAKGGHVVDFTNSDPLLIKMFLVFLRRVCGIAESRLRAFVYCYADQDVDALTHYWSNVTGIPLKQFTKPFVRELTPNVSRRKMSWGLVHVRYADKRLLNLILKWSEDYINARAGT